MQRCVSSPFVAQDDAYFSDISDAPATTIFRRGHNVLDRFSDVLYGVATGANAKAISTASRALLSKVPGCCPSCRPWCQRWAEPMSRPSPAPESAGSGDALVATRPAEAGECRRRRSTCRHRVS